MTLGTNDRLNELFQKYVDRNISEEEYAELFMYINNPELKDQLLEFMDLYNKEVKTDASIHEVDWESMYASITKPTPAKSTNYFNWRVLYFAASLLLIVSIGLFVTYRNSGAKKSDALVFKNDISPVTNKAILTLANGTVLNLTDSVKGSLKVSEGITVRRDSEGLVTYHVSPNATASAEVTHTLSTPYGGTFSVVLSDGSKVWLNASSSISFPEQFSANERRVRVKGEVYFEVAKDKLKPFFVNTGKSEVKVLGTHFNVMAYHDDIRSELTLLEGSIRFSKNNYNKILTPGKQLQFAENTTEVYEIDADAAEVLAWKNNLFVFNATSLHEIMKSLSRWYNVKIRYEGEVPDISFTGEIPRTSNVSKVLKALELTEDVNFGIDGDVIICRKRETE